RPINVCFRLFAGLSYAPPPKFQDPQLETSQSRKDGWIMRKIVYLLVVAALLLLAACSSTPQTVAPADAPAADAPAEGAATDAPAAEEPAAEEPAAEAPAAEDVAGEVAAPIEYPEGQVLEGSREPAVFPVEDIIEFRAFDEYCEPE